MIECTEAQRVISEMHDGESVDPQLRADARDHCRTCPECEAFVRTLIEVGDLPVPEMDAEALDRVLKAVRAEFPAEAQPVADVRAVPDSAADAPVPILRRLQPAWAPWAVAAATLLIVAGIFTTQGVRYLLQPASDSARSDGMPTYGEESAADLQVPGDAELAAESAAPDSAPEATEPAGAAFVTFEAGTYRFSSALDAPPEGSPAGSVVSSLDTGQPAAGRPVYRDAATRGIVIATDDEGVFWLFEPVTRSLRGAGYVLRSDPVTSFGQWPQMPSAIPVPASPDGAP